MPPSFLQGPVIITRYIGPTNHRGSRVSASHKRDNETIIRVLIPWDDALSSEANHRAAANACLARCPFDPDLSIVGRGHDADAYFWFCVSSWQLEA